MENWAKLVAEGGETTYVNSATGKYLAEIDHPPVEHWEEYTSMTKKEHTGRSLTP